MDELLMGAHGTRSLFEFGGRDLPAAEVIRRLSPFLSAERMSRIDRVVAQRTYGVVTVVEGLANSGNVSAVMRTAEGFGFQRFDIVTGDADFKVSKRTTQGAEKWLDVRVWDSARACVDALHEEGYRVAVTHLAEDAVPIDTLDFSRPTAVVLGNELSGVSPAMQALADVRCMVPINGFVESFNISVAAAVVLYHAREDRKRRTGPGGDLTPDEAERLTADFYVRGLRNAAEILVRTLREDPLP